MEHAPSVGRSAARPKKSSNRLVASFIIVFGLAGLLAAGLLVNYAKKRGMNLSDLFKSQPAPVQQPETPTLAAQTSSSGQVLAAEELGFRVWGAGATDPNRKESVISERIGAQIADLRLLYQQEIQNKPELMGSLVLQLTISPAGGVTKVEVYAARVKDEDFKKAVVSESYKWRFPEATAGLTKVNYPLLFVPPKMDVATVLQWERGAGPAEPVHVAKAPKGKAEPGRPKKPVDEGIANPPNPTPPLPPDPGGPPPRVKPIIGQYEVLYPTAVYREPRNDSPMVARIEAGTKINVVDVHDEWLEVRSRQGRPPGFIKKEAVTPLGNR